jgi:two-component system, chemotaxis family, protein-glutamate methylesterase/glutaminase
MEELSIIVIGASSGGVEALGALFPGLKPDLNAAVFVVLHIPPDAKSYLPQILSRFCPLSVKHAQDGEKIKPGCAYIAPPNQHLILKKGSMHLTFGPQENYTRPAIDPLFESAAAAYGSRVIGVILTGNLSDGTKGLIRIKQAGGMAVVQDPEEALFSSMPSSALQYVPVDYRLPVAEIAPLLNQLTDQVVLAEGKKTVNPTEPAFTDNGTELIKKDIQSYEQGYEINQRSVITCPECGGILWELQDGNLVYYRCHTGHAFNPDVLLASHDSELEKKYWTTIRLLVEKAAIANRLAMKASENGNQDLKAYYLSIAKEAETEAQRIRETWLNGRAKNSKSVSAGEQANDDVTQSLE